MRIEISRNMVSKSHKRHVDQKQPDTHINELKLYAHPDTKHKPGAAHFSGSNEEVNSGRRGGSPCTGHSRVDVKMGMLQTSYFFIWGPVCCLSAWFQPV